MKLRPELEPQIAKAQEIYPIVMKFLEGYTNLVDEKGDEEEVEYNKLLDFLSELTNKNIRERNYSVWEYWEAEGLERESFKIAFPDPIIVENITREEVVEMVNRITKLQIPDYLKTDFIEKNGFECHICDYYQDLIALNFKKYKHKFFHRQKNAEGEWYEPTVEEIVDKLI